MNEENFLNKIKKAVSVTRSTINMIMDLKNLLFKCLKHHSHAIKFLFTTFKSVLD